MCVLLYFVFMCVNGIEFFFVLYIMNGISGGDIVCVV